MLWQGLTANFWQKRLVHDMFIAFYGQTHFSYTKGRFMS